MPPHKKRAEDRAGLQPGLRQKTVLNRGENVVHAIASTLSLIHI